MKINQAHYPTKWPTLFSSSNLRHADVRAYARGPDGREEQEGVEEERLLQGVNGGRRREVFGLAEGEDGEGGEAEAAQVGIAGLGKVGGFLISYFIRQETIL